MFVIKVFVLYFIMYLNFCDFMCAAIGVIINDDDDDDCKVQKLHIYRTNY